MSTQTVTIDVDGMTCGHCVRSVQEELGSLPGVTDVHIELVTGGTSTVRFAASQPVSDDDVRAAVQEAGYQVVG